MAQINKNMIIHDIIQIDAGFTDEFLRAGIPTCRRFPQSVCLLPGFHCYAEYCMQTSHRRYSSDASAVRSSDSHSPEIRRDL